MNTHDPIAIADQRHRRADAARRTRAALVTLALAASGLAVPLALSPGASAVPVSTATWTQQFPATSPPARAFGGSAYDLAKRQFVVFGGYNGSATTFNVASMLSETWTFDGSTWSQRFPATSPSARGAVGMAYDAGHANAVLFGGLATSGGRLEDTWTWDGTSWTLRTPATSPAARVGASLVFDTLHQRLVLFGGRSNTTGLTYCDTWTWDGTTWAQVGGACTSAAPLTSAPSPRDFATMIYDDALQKTVLFGGRPPGSCCFPLGTALGDTWVFDGATWAQATSPGPAARGFTYAAYNPALARVELFGGSGGSQLFGDTWSFGAKVDTSGLVPVPGGYPSDQCDSGTNVVAGFVGPTYLKVRETPDPANASNTWVCVAAEAAGVHLGGKVIVSGAVPGVPVGLDQDATSVAACSTNASNQRVQSGMLLAQPYWVDVTPLPDGSPDAAWVCVRLNNTTGFRVRLTTTTGTGAQFVPDLSAPHVPAYTEDPWPVTGQPSAACKGQVGSTRLVNARVGTSQVLLYSWSESAAKTHVCFRSQAPNAGGRLDLDTSASPGVSPVLVTSSSDLSPCTFPVITRDQPPTFGVFTSSNPTVPPPPSSACVTVAGTGMRATVGSSGPATASVAQDTA